MKQALLLVTLLSFSVPACRPVNRDPVKNFDHIWNAFQKRYAFFKLRGVDWKKERAKYRPRLNQQSTDKELYKVLKLMTDKLRDYHVSIDAPWPILRSYRGTFRHWAYTWRVRRRARRLGLKIMKRYVGKPKSYGDADIRWGIIPKANVGLVQINSMEDIVSCWDLRRLAPGHFCSWWTNDRTAVRWIMEQVMKDFKKVKAIIVDVRFNTGGYDSVSREIARFFVKNRTKLYSKREKLGDRLLERKTFYAEPASVTRTKNVFVLTSHMTASAAEIFALSMKALDHVTLVGGPTRGTLSDVYEEKMPNGWEFTLSNEIYYSVHGKVYEKIGVTPDILVPYPVDQPKRLVRTLRRDLKRVGDRAIERILKKLRP